MSQVVTATLLPASSLDQLRKAAVPKKSWFSAKRIDNYFAFLDQAGVPLGDFQHPGHYLVTALLYLKENGIDLLHSDQDETAALLTKARSVTHILLTPGHKHALLHPLQTLKLVDDQLERYCTDFYTESSPHHVPAMRDAMRFATDALARITDETILVIQVG